MSSRLPSLEELDGPLVPLGRRAGGERAQIAALASLWIAFP
jgi:hypothetical protein